MEKKTKKKKKKKKKKGQIAKRLPSRVNAANSLDYCFAFHLHWHLSFFSSHGYLLCYHQRRFLHSFLTTTTMSYCRYP